MNPIYSVLRFFRNSKSSIKWAWQRVYRGYDDRMLWDFSDEMARITVEILTWYKEKGQGCPAGYTEKEWKQNLAVMIQGFKSVQEIQDVDWTDETTLKKHEARIKLGLQFFAKDFQSLWD